MTDGSIALDGGWCSRGLSGAPLRVRGRPWLIFDTETTGLDIDRDELTEFAALVIDDDGRRAGEARWRRSDGARELVAAVRTLDRTVEDAIVVGHNIEFDLRMLRSHPQLRDCALARPARWICTMRMTGFRASLSRLASSQGIVAQHLHTASGDAETLALTVVRLIAAACERHLTTIAGLAVVTPPGRHDDRRRSDEQLGWSAVRSSLDRVVPLPLVTGQQRRAFSNVMARLHAPAAGPADPAELEQVLNMLHNENVTALALEFLLAENVR